MDSRGKQSVKPNSNRPIKGNSVALAGSGYSKEENMRPLKPIGSNVILEGFRYDSSRPFKDFKGRIVSIEFPYKSVKAAFAGKILAIGPGVKDRVRVDEVVVFDKSKARRFIEEWDGLLLVKLEHILGVMVEPHP